MCSFYVRYQNPQHYSVHSANVKTHNPVRKGRFCLSRTNQFSNFLLAKSRKVFVWYKDSGVKRRREKGSLVKSLRIRCRHVDLAMSEVKKTLKDQVKLDGLSK